MKNIKKSDILLVAGLLVVVILGCFFMKGEKLGPGGSYELSYSEYVEKVENGDKFVPFGMLGKKLVSDYLTDNKKNMLEKKRQLIISDADGNIIWLIGERTDNRYRVSENTSSVLYLSLI